MMTFDGFKRAQKGVHIDINVAVVILEIFGDGCECMREKLVECFVRET